jgi:8-oxo-dGTP pyrophosphatase MutT (NUDIX family)
MVTAADGPTGDPATPTADVPVRPAATVMLVKDTPSGLEVFVLRRVAGMAFAGGMTAFPGGAVDPADHDEPIDWAGPDPRWWAAQLGVAVTDARALVVAAVRELFEETGVLLAAAPAAGSHRVVTDDDRLDVLERRLNLPTVLARAGLRMRADLLRPWANWITPPGRTRRYDTFFFAAAMPAGQHARMLTSEADLGQWRAPDVLLAEHEVGAVRLMPPTVAMLGDLAATGSVERVMSARRVITPVRVRAPVDPPRAVWS